MGDVDAGDMLNVVSPLLAGCTRNALLCTYRIKSVIGGEYPSD